MSVSSAYSLDANVFIEAARRYYAFDLVPRFWTSLEELARDGRICSVDRVVQELERGKDVLAGWAARDFAHGFARTDTTEVLTEFRTVMAWMSRQAQFSDAVKQQFAGVAAGWIVADARTNANVVVTMEHLPADALRRVPIPNACSAFEVRYVNTFEMLRELDVRLA